jgi:hypothetical protein
VLPHLDWRSSEPISGTAILSAQDGHSTISGSGNPIGFAYDEVGGDRSAHPIWTADCATKEIDSATPLNQPLGKSGVLETDFQRAFLPGPQIRLPAGTWDITAIADFLEGSGCTGVHHAIRAAARITVTD